MAAMPLYHGVDELDSGDFGEIGAREVLSRIPGPLLFKLLNVGVGGPDLFLPRLVCACRDALPIFVEEVTDRLKDYATCFDSDNKNLVDRVIAQLRREAAEEAETEDDGDD